MQHRRRTPVALAFATDTATMDSCIVDLALPAPAREGDRTLHTVIRAPITSRPVVAGLTHPAGSTLRRVPGHPEVAIAVRVRTAYPSLALAPSPAIRTSLLRGPHRRADSHRPRLPVRGELDPLIP